MVRKSKRQSLWFYCLLGLGLAFILDSVKAASPFYYAASASFALLFAMVFDGKGCLSLTLRTLILAALVCVPWILPDWEALNSPWYGLIIPMLYVGHCFNAAYHWDNGWRVSYASLFYAVWNSVPLLLLAGLFSCLALGMVYLAAALLKLAGFSEFNQLIDTYPSYFRITLYFAGIGIAKQSINVTDKLRFILLKMSYYLYPLLAFNGLLYAVLFILFSHTHPELDQDFYSFFFVLSGIIFFNAYFQDGESLKPYPKLIEYLMHLFRLILIPASIRLWWCYLDFSRYDLNLILCLTLALMYCFIYGVSPFFTRSETLIKRANITIALLFLCGMLGLNTPWYPLGMQVSLKHAHKRATKIQAKKEQQRQNNAERMKKAGIKWVQFKQDALVKAFIAGRNDSGSIGVCRVHSGNKVFIGQLERSLCSVIDQKKILVGSSFDVLTVAKPDKLKWRGWFKVAFDDKNYLPLYSVSNQSDRMNRFVCRMIVNNRIYLGVASHGSCHSIVDGKIVKKPSDEATFLNWAGN